MKILVFIILVILAAYFYFSKDSASGAGDKQKAAGPAPATQARQPAGQAKPPPSGDMESVINYGTGYTQMKIKQKSQQKLEGIQQRHAQETSREAGDR